MADYERQYGRNDVDYETWYSQWSKQLARTYTLAEIDRLLGRSRSALTEAAQVHHRAIARSSSMTSNSQRRAQARNVVAATGEYAIALRGAREIHELFPEHAKAQPNESVQDDAG